MKMRKMRKNDVDKRQKRVSTSAGFEPTIFNSVDRRVIHCATKPPVRLGSSLTIERPVIKVEDNQDHHADCFEQFCDQSTSSLSFKQDQPR
ncbi:hypothetical protein L596_015389 [Steinernema carpocapsae]|uniref:Uncharacterized protein n=1 Tax=Steinernema carpocapsae TaxID=34508 RepID=A0A4V6A379_STECR|nr:hypothetical protein L596_015389 [Steinernema carpocapsae]